MTISAIEDYEDIARRLKELRPEPIKEELWCIDSESSKAVEIDWSFFNGGADSA